MLTALFVIVGLSILILGHEAGHFFAAKRLGLKVDEFGFGFPPRMFSWKRGETEYSFNWLPFGGFVKIAGENDRMHEGVEKLVLLPEAEKQRLFVFRPAWQRTIITVAGVFVNFVIGWLLVSSILMIGTPQAVVVSEVQKDSPADEVGIESGDVIKNYLHSSDFINFVGENRGKEIEVSLQRGDEVISIKVTPRITTTPGEGALGVLLAEAGEARQSFFPALWEGLKRTGLIFWITILTFYELIKNLFVHGSLLGGVVGPVGIFGVAQQTGELGFIYLVQLISLISINLAAINLIPFPALDGGRLFLIVIEKIKGSPISLKTEAWVNGIGFVFLIFLMIIITIRDVSRWL
jgi:regulator of sigma E protease